LHALHPFALDPEHRLVQVVNGEALARVRFPGADPLALSQTDQFTALPEMGLAQSSPRQWHLEANFAATSGRRWLLSVVQSGRAGQEDLLPAVGLLDGPGGVGLQIGEAQVRFNMGLEAFKVSCLSPGSGGAPEWLEYTH